MVKYANFKVGRKVLRNLQDYALEQAADLRERLHENYQANGIVPLPLAFLDAFVDGGSVVRGKSESTASRKAATPLAPSIRSNDRPGKLGAQLPVPPTQDATSRVPSNSSNGVSSESGADQGNAIPAPSHRSNSESSKRGGERSPPETKCRPPYTSQGARSYTSKSTNSSVISDDRQRTPAPQSRDSNHDRPATGISPLRRNAANDPDRDHVSSSYARSNSIPAPLPVTPSQQAQYRTQYRDRSRDRVYDGDIRPLQTRRSNSPRDEDRPPRPQDVKTKNDERLTRDSRADKLEACKSNLPRSSVDTTKRHPASLHQS